MKDNIKQELKENWGKIATTLIVVAILFTSYYDLRDDFKAWLKKPNQVTQNSPVPINFNANGLQTSSPPPIYVNVQPQIKEISTAGITTKPDPKTSPDIVINDPLPTYRLVYNGNPFTWTSPIVDEKYKFDNGQFVYTRDTSINVNVEVPQPRWGIGIGKSFQGDYAILEQYRIGKTPFNIWAYQSKADQAIGLMFVQYASSEARGGKK